MTLTCRTFDPGAKARLLSRHTPLSYRDAFYLCDQLPNYWSARQAANLSAAYNIADLPRIVLMMKAGRGDWI